MRAVSLLLLVGSLFACAERAAPAPGASTVTPPASTSGWPAASEARGDAPPTDSATGSTSVFAPARRPIAELGTALAADPRQYLGKKLTLEGVVVGPVKERVHDDHSEHLAIHYYDVPIADALDEAERAIICEVLHDHPAGLELGARVTVVGVGSNRDLVRPRAMPFYLSTCRITRR